MFKRRTNLESRPGRTGAYYKKVSRTGIDREVQRGG
jgi:hypothetical protein